MASFGKQTITGMRDLEKALAALGTEMGGKILKSAANKAVKRTSGKQGRQTNNGHHDRHGTDGQTVASNLQRPVGGARLFETKRQKENVLSERPRHRQHRRDQRGVLWCIVHRLQAERPAAPTVVR